MVEDQVGASGSYRSEGDRTAEMRGVDADYRKAHDQMAHVGPSGGNRQTGPAGEVYLFDGFVGASADAEFCLSADLRDLPLSNFQWVQYATVLSRWRS